MKCAVLFQKMPQSSGLAWLWERIW